MQISTINIKTTNSYYMRKLMQLNGNKTDFCLSYNRWQNFVKTYPAENTKACAVLDATDDAREGSVSMVA